MFLASREERKQRMLRERFEQASRDFERIVRMIVEKYKPHRIYQWGSLLRLEHFSELSDIDIAVEGLKSMEQYFSLLGEADEMTQFPLDIVELEKIHTLHAESIRAKGKLIYEKP